RQGEDGGVNVGSIDAGSRQDRGGPIPQLLLRLRPAFVQRDTTGAPDDLGQRPVRDPLPHRRAAPAKDREIRALRLGKVDRLPHEPALADARRAVDDRQTRGSGFDCLVQETAQYRELALPSDDSRPQVSSRSALEGALDPSEQRVGLDWGRLALQLKLSRVIEPEQLAGGVE